MIQARVFSGWWQAESFPCSRTWRRRTQHGNLIPILLLSAKCTPKISQIFPDLSLWS